MSASESIRVNYSGFLKRNRIRIRKFDLLTVKLTCNTLLRNSPKFENNFVISTKCTFRIRSLLFSPISWLTNYNSGELYLISRSIRICNACKKYILMASQVYLVKSTHEFISRFFILNNDYILSDFPRGVTRSLWVWSSIF